MKFSESWLREWVNLPENSTQALTDQLTMLGLEVEAYYPVAPSFSQVVVGEIIEAIKHPNADRLKVCKVNVGLVDFYTIVCGAPNARAGVRAPVALPYAKLPNNVQIKRTQIRGVESAGMICAARELGLPETADGIMELPVDAPIGIDFRAYLQLNDHILDVNITPNRGDCLSILGIAREVAAVNQIKLNTPKGFQVIAKPSYELKDDSLRESLLLEPALSETFPIIVKAKEACPRYAGRIIRNINVQAKTPIWMQEKLARSEIRSIHPVVDITNYVMLELGQPLHAFDLNLLEGSIVVQNAKKDETLMLLDGRTITLNQHALIISDAKQAHALAGVMGGSAAMVNTATTNIFLESAFFSPLYVRRNAKLYELHTDASHRFERGVDPSLVLIALERATELILTLLGGQAGSIQVVDSREYLPQNHPIVLRREKIQRCLGFTLSDAHILSILNSLNIKPLKENKEGFEVIPPSYRFDLTIESDLIEELARLYGYNNIPTENTITYAISSIKAPKQVDLIKARSILVDQGYYETINYSFISKDYYQWFFGNKDPIMLENPISQDLSIMRPSLLPGLVKTYLHNYHRQHDRIRLFEIGVCFTDGDQACLQKEKIGGLVCGPLLPEQWGEKSKKVNFYDVKGDVENLLNALGCQIPDFLPINVSTLLHPGQSASLFLNGQIMGHVGALHPSLLNLFKITSSIYLFELDVALMGASLLKKVFEPFSKFPFIRRDISLIVDQHLSWKELKEKITLFTNEHLSRIKLFDIYEGKPIQPDKKSVSIALIFQSSTQTLVEAEVNHKMEEFLDFLNKTIDMTLRD